MVLPDESANTGERSPIPPPRLKTYAGRSKQGSKKANTERPSAIALATNSNQETEATSNDQGEKRKRQITETNVELPAKRRIK